MNIDGLTNKQLLTAALRAMLKEAGEGHLIKASDADVIADDEIADDEQVVCRLRMGTLRQANAALLEVDRPKGNKADKANRRQQRPRSLS